MPPRGRQGGSRLEIRRKRAAILAADVAGYSRLMGEDEIGTLRALSARRAIALSPHHPNHFLGTLGNACRLAGRIDEAIAAFTACNARNPTFGLVDLVLSHQQAGRIDEARDLARRLLVARPDFTVAGWRRTQVRRDTTSLDADSAALRAVELPAG